jgi:hypothetical protein
VNTDPIVNVTKVFSLSLALLKKIYIAAGSLLHEKFTTPVLNDIVTNQFSPLTILAELAD